MRRLKQWLNFRLYLLWMWLRNGYCVNSSGDLYRSLDIRASKGYDPARKLLRRGEVLARIDQWSPAGDLHFVQIGSGRYLEYVHEHLGNPELYGVKFKPWPCRPVRTFRTRNSLDSERRRRITLQR